MEQLLDIAAERDVQAVALVGDIGGGESRPDSYRAIFRLLGQSGLPAYWVPGPGDAPIAEYLREAYNMEIVFPFLHGVHGTAAFTPGYVLVAGMGGQIDDDPDVEREEVEGLRYPRWEVEYRLKIMRELQEHLLILLFATPPAHRGQEPSGSDVLKEVIATHRPRLVVTGGERGQSWIARTLVLAPGSLAEGQYAIADLQGREADMEQLAAAAS
jgi:Icc-related predicted phosphoesterase